ncbi:MAG: DUF3530 family protein [Gammaproteobacteria bacterium]|nr:DUF3530 family protein [Gammaproteobacteria bacterium]
MKYLSILLLAVIPLVAQPQPDSLRPAIVVDMAPDHEREIRLRGEIEDLILDGEAVTLTGADGVGFLGIYTEAENGPARGSVVLLHGRGFHPDWQDVIHPLRVGLTRFGWNTLSIQLPVLDKAASYYDYVAVFPHAGPRIEAAIDRLRRQHPGPIVLLAHSCGTHMAQHWMLHAEPAALASFDAYVGIGMGATDIGQPMREPFPFDRLSVPVLDIYAEDDFRAVRLLAGVRRLQLEANGHPHHAQVVVPGSEHYFVDRGMALTESIGAWLTGVGGQDRRP